MLELVRVSKRSPGVLALDGVDFTLFPGEVHALFGENGAGKSTLISIVAGAAQPTDGAIRFRGEPVTLRSVHDARQRGVSAVFQEFSLVPQMSVEENLFLGAESTNGPFLDRSAMRRRALELLGRLGFGLKPTTPVHALTRAEQQMVEIAKAFRSDLSVLILDEPTASLTERETEQLFDIIGQVKAKGVGIIYITHRIREIRRVGDRVTVLRDGRYIATVDAKTTDEDELVQLMTGRVVGQIFPNVRHAPGRELFKIEALTTRSGSVRDATLSLASGEILGLAGLIGSGKSKVMRAAFKLEPIASGCVRLKGEDVTGLSIAELLKRGLFYLPADRRAEGLAMMRPCRENMSLPSLDIRPYASGIFLARRGEIRATQSLAERLNLQPPRIDRAPDQFSGGNQQKVLLAKSLSRPVDVFVFDEPTVGVDVGTRAAIYAFIRDLTEAGAGVILISSDLPEVLNMSNRVIVFRRGRVATELAGAEITEENVLRHFFEEAA